MRLFGIFPSYHKCSFQNVSCPRPVDNALGMAKRFSHQSGFSEAVTSPPTPSYFIPSLIQCYSIGISILFTVLCGGLLSFDQSANALMHGVRSPGLLSLTFPPPCFAYSYLPFVPLRILVFLPFLFLQLQATLFSRTSTRSFNKPQLACWNLRLLALGATR